MTYIISIIITSSIIYFENTHLVVYLQQDKQDMKQHEENVNQHVVVD